MQKTVSQFGISKADKDTIDRLVVQTGEHYMHSIPLAFYFKNITPSHYMYLGWAIGQIQATEKTLENFHQTQNPLSKCRAN